MQFTVLSSKPSNNINIFVSSSGIDIIRITHEIEGDLPYQI